MIYSSGGVDEGVVQAGFIGLLEKEFQ